MFGHSYTGGQTQQKQKVIERWAYFPVKLTSGKRIWAQPYWQIDTYYDDDGKPPIKGIAWTWTMTGSEYLLWMLKNAE